LNRFHSDRAHLANAAEGSWILTQFSRWGWSAFPSNRLELLSQVYRSDLCSRAIERAGFADLRPERAPFALADGVAFDQDNPLDYLNQLPYCRATALESIQLPTGSSPRPIAAH
jgi:hypothetical protein